MVIEVLGSEEMLEQLRWNFEDELQKAGFAQGPRVGAMDAGSVACYTREDTIVSIQITEETEDGSCALRIDSEQELSEIDALWDSALITYGKQIMEKLIDFAKDKTRVKQGLR